MSPEELASKELAAWRQRENRHVRLFICDYLVRSIMIFEISFCFKYIYTFWESRNVHVTKIEQVSLDWLWKSFCQDLTGTKEGSVMTSTFKSIFDKRRSSWILGSGQDIFWQELIKIGETFIFIIYLFYSSSKLLLVFPQGLVLPCEKYR